MNTQTASRSSGSNNGRRRRGTLVESACLECRRRKSKCDGLRPTCSSCQHKRTECKFDYEPGVTKVQGLKREAEKSAERERGTETGARRLFALTVPYITNPEVCDVVKQVVENGCGLEKACILVDNICQQRGLNSYTTYPAAGYPTTTSVDFGRDTRNQQQLPPISTLNLPAAGTRLPLYNTGNTTSIRQSPLQRSYNSGALLYR